jgi:hypothetical protein
MGHGIERLMITKITLLCTERVETAQIPEAWPPRGESESDLYGRKLSVESTNLVSECSNKSDTTKSKCYKDMTQTQTPTQFY